MTDLKIPTVLKIHRINDWLYVSDGHGYGPVLQATTQEDEEFLAQVLARKMTRTQFGPKEENNAVPTSAQR